MPTKSGIIGTVKLKMEDGTFVDLPDPISLEEITAFAEQYEFVRVVRCKDCRHYGNGCALLFPEDGYCYDGERREDDSD